MKKAMSTIGWVGLILVLIFLVTLILGVTNLYGGSKELIKKLLGEKTEQEITHEQSIQAEKEFESLINNLEKCKESKNINCGCIFNIKNFNKNQLILSRVLDIELIYIANIEKADVIKEVKSGILVKKADIKNTNCYFDENFKKNDVTVARIFFDKEKPYLHKLSKFLFIPWQSTETLNTEYPLYKDSKGSICWLSEKAQNLNECQ